MARSQTSGANMFGDNMGGVVISPNIKKESVRISPSGDIIDPNTKQILQKNEPEIVEQPAMVEPEPVKTALTIQERIDATKKLLADLEEEKRLEIQKMKEALARLENE